MEEYPILFVRIERASTNSWITYLLPRKMTLTQAEIVLQKIMPGWEVVSGCLENPDLC